MLQAALNRIRDLFVDPPEMKGSAPDGVPIIGTRVRCDVLGRDSVRHPASSRQPMIGQTGAFSVRLPTDQQGPSLSTSVTNHGRGHRYADHFAAAFLSWVASQPLTSSALSDDAIVEMAAAKFAPEARMQMPPVRNLLGALKRAPGVRVKRDVRVRDAHGAVVGKTTVYTLATTDSAVDTNRHAA